MKKQGLLAATGGIGIGFINGLLGAGGGMLAVPLLKKCGLSTKQAHAGSIAIILPLSAVSAAIYLLNGRMTFVDGWTYMPAGAIGAVLGAWLLGKITAKWVTRIFALVMLAAGVKLLFF